MAQLDAGTPLGFPEALGTVDGDYHQLAMGIVPTQIESQDHSVFFFQTTWEGSLMRTTCFGKCREGYREDRQNTVNEYRWTCKS